MDHALRSPSSTSLMTIASLAPPFTPTSQQSRIHSTSGLIYRPKPPSPSTPPLEVPDTPSRLRVKSTPTARRVRSRLVLVDSPEDAELGRQTMLLGNPASPSHTRRNRNSHIGKEKTRRLHPDYEVMGAEFYDLGLGEGRQREMAVMRLGLEVEERLVGVGLNGLRYIEEGILYLQAQPPSLVFVDLANMSNDIDHSSVVSPWMQAASKANRYLGWLQLFEKEVYKELAAKSRSIRQSSLSSSPTPQLYTVHLSFLALTSNLTYAREILRRECVVRAMLPQMAENRWKMSTQRKNIMQEIEDLKTMLSKIIEQSSEALNGNVDIARRSTDTDNIEETDSRLIQLVDTFPTLQHALVDIAQTVIDVSARDIDVVSPQEIIDYQSVPSLGRVTFANPPSPPIVQKIMQPLRNDIQGLQKVWNWISTALPGWKEAEDLIASIRKAQESFSRLCDDFDMLATSDLPSLDLESGLRTLNESYKTLVAAQSFMPIDLRDPPNEVESLPWLPSSVHSQAASHHQILRRLDEESGSLARSIGQLPRGLASFEQIVASRRQPEEYDSALGASFQQLRGVLERLESPEAVETGIEQELNLVKGDLDNIAEKLPTAFQELDQLRRQQIIGFVIGQNSPPALTEMSRADVRLRRCVSARLAENQSLLRVAREVHGGRSLREAYRVDVEALASVIAKISTQARDLEESLFTMLHISKWSEDCDALPEMPAFDHDLEDLRRQYYDEVAERLRALRSRLPTAQIQDHSQLEFDASSLEHLLSRLCKLSKSVEKVYQQRQYLVDLEERATAIERQLDGAGSHVRASSLDLKDPTSPYSHIDLERDLNQLDKRIARTPKVATESPPSISSAVMWNDPVSLGQRAAELSSLTPPSSPEVCTSRVMPGPGGGEATVAKVDQADDEDRFASAICELQSLDNTVRSYLNERSARLHLRQFKQPNHPLQPSTTLESHYRPHRSVRANSISSSRGHSRLSPDMSSQISTTSHPRSVSGHSSLYKETASSRARRESTMAIRAQRAAGGGVRPRLMSGGGGSSSDVFDGPALRRVESTISSSSTRSSRSTLVTHHAGHEVKIGSASNENEISSSKKDHRRSSQTIVRSQSLARINERIRREKGVVRPHPRLDAAVRHTARVHEEDLAIQAASSPRIDNESIEGAYTFAYGNKSATRFCRIMIESDKVWVRVGGGFESLNEFINRTFGSFISASFAHPVSPETSHATLMGFDSPLAMSRILSSPERRTPSEDDTPRSGRYSFVGSVRGDSMSPAALGGESETSRRDLRDDSASPGMVGRGSPLMVRSISSSSMMTGSGILTVKKTNGSIKTAARRGSLGRVGSRVGERGNEEYKSGYAM